LRNYSTQKGRERFCKKFMNKETMAKKKDLGKVKNDTDKIFEEMERNAQKRHNELLDCNDKKMKILLAIQQELALRRLIFKKHNKKPKKQEKRIKVLELHKTV